MRQLIIVLLVTGVLSAVPRTKRQTGINNNSGRQTSSQNHDSVLKFGSELGTHSHSSQLNSNFGSQPGLQSHGVIDGGSVIGDHGEVVPGHVPTKKLTCGGPGTTCVPYYQCDKGEINIDGSGLIDIRTGSSCPRYLDVCCRNKIVPTKPPNIYRPGCGRRNYNGIGAHVHSLNSTQSQFGEFPWMVAILRVELIGSEEVNLYLCGGSLIHPNIVLTAAHCIFTYGASNLRVRGGEWDTQSTYEPFPHQDRFVKQVIFHPDFNGGNLWNDFALLVLDGNFELGPNVDTICIPSHDVIFNNPKCIATGWGKDEFGIDGRFQSILKKVELQIVPHKNCQSLLQTTRLGSSFALHNSFLCAGGDPDVDTCKGDGGSPYICSAVDGTYYQVGIVAWGIGCGEYGIPGVYADVTKFSKWIEDNALPYLQPLF